MRRIIGCFVCLLVIGLSVSPAQASEQSSPVAKLLELQQALKEKSLSLNEAATKLEEIRSEISYLPDADESSSLMAATDSAKKDIEDLRKRAALLIVCPASEYVVCRSAVSDL